MKITGEIKKSDDEQRLIFGWASVAADENGNAIIDSQGDVIPIEELERAAYEFVEFSRKGGEMHQIMGVARLVESIIFTPQKLELLGISGVPFGWWVGFRVTDETVWQKIKSGEYSMFSIGGDALRSEVNDATD